MSQSISIPDAVAAFLRAGSYSQLRELLEQHGCLLTDEALELLVAKHDELQQRGEQELVDSVAMRVNVLVRCRQAGIEATFGQRPSLRVSAATAAELTQVFSQLQIHTSPSPDRLELLERAAKLIDPGREPLRWAAVYVLVGDLYREAKWLSRSERMVKSIRAYDRALIVYTAEQHPAERIMALLGQARTWHSLSVLPEDRRRALETIGECQRLVSQANDRAITASVNYEWGRQLTESEVGSKQENLDSAIVALKDALDCYRVAEDDKEAARVLNTLGNAYLMDSGPDRGWSIESAIECYKDALKIRKPTEYPTEWLNTTHNLANAFRLRLQGDPRENVDLALKLLTSILDATNESEHAWDRALCRADLGAILVQCVGTQPALDEAIDQLKIAVDALTKLSSPLAAVQAKIDLGLAYLYSTNDQGAANIEAARIIFDEVRSTLEAKDFPLENAQIQTSIGLAMLQINRGNALRNTLDAIASFQEAIKLSDRARDPEQWASVHASLGNSYLTLADLDRPAWADVAIEHFQLALEIFRREAYPTHWATLSNNIGNALLKRGGIDRDKDVHEARKYYTQALEVHQRGSHPKQWARTIGNLGSTCVEFKSRELRRQFALEGIQQLRDALQVYTWNVAPDDCARLTRNLGTAMLELGMHVEADQLWRRAFAYWSDSVAWSTESDLPARRASRIAKDRARVLAQRNCHAAAVEAIEAGKTIRLRHASYRSRHLPQVLDEPKKREYELLWQRRQMLQSKYRALTTLGDRSRLGSMTEPSPSVADLEHIVQQLNETTEFLRAITPNDDGRPVVLTYQRIQTLAHRHEVCFVYFLYPQSDEECLQAFIIHPHSPSDEIPSKDHLYFPDLNRTCLQRLLVGSQIVEFEVRPDTESGESGPLNCEENSGWDACYRNCLRSNFRSSSSAFRKWRDCVEFVLNDLSSKLARVLDQRLNELIDFRIVLLSDGPLSQIPLTALTIDDSTTLADKYRMTTTPSASAVAGIIDGQFERLRSTESMFAAMVNPDGSLPFSLVEYADVATAGESGQLFIGPAATWERLSITAQHADILGLATHGWYVRHAAHESALLLAHRRRGAIRASAANQDEFEKLTLDDVWAGRLPLRKGAIVVAEACESGIIDPTSGHEELDGFPAAFLAAGASSVLATLWPVADLPAAILMSACYQKLLAGDPAERALAAAAKELREMTKSEAEAWLQQARQTTWHQLNELTAGATVVDTELDTKIAMWLELDTRITEAELQMTNAGEHPFLSPLDWAGLTLFGVSLG